MNTILTKLLLLSVIMVIGPIYVLLGALTGWITGLFWGDTILSFLFALGMPVTVTMWQLGAVLGFFGMFTRFILTTNVTVEKD